MQTKAFLKSTKIISRVLFFVWAGCLLLFSLVSLTGMFSFIDFLCVVVFISSFFLMPAILIEYKKNPILMAHREKKGWVKPSLSYTIWGIILIEFSPFMIVGGILGINYSGNSNGAPMQIPLFLGIFLFLLGILLINGCMTKVKLAGEKMQRANSTHKQGINKGENKDYSQFNKYNGTDEYETNKEKVNKDDISYVDGMEGHDFEYFCADLLKKNGFENVTVTPGSGDQGADIIAFNGGVKYAVQCKNYASPLGNTPIQEVNAGKIFYKCHVGVVMTNSTFTPGAKALADATGTLLWDRNTVEKMIKVGKQ